MDLYSTARQMYHAWKRATQKNAVAQMSKVRRIDKVYPPKSDRIVAMTFDDGPTIAPAKPYSSQGITSMILDVMKEYDARGTFDVIGSTGENYPDSPGKPGSFAWGGIRFDHYPQFGKDSSAGAVNQPDLVKRILAEGHEISNHGYRHLAFGPQRVIYGARAHFNTLEEVVDDLKRLHVFIQNTFNYTIRLGRPPHYIDKIPDGHSSFDAYEISAYQYLGASFDGGGWRKPSEGSLKEVENMVEPLRRVLEKDPDSLSGQIIFEKDGYNMSLEAPVVEALPLKLALLKHHGYRIVPVSELLLISPYTDMGSDHPGFSSVHSLERRGLAVLYRDNTFRPDAFCKISEMQSWLSRALRNQGQNPVHKSGRNPGHPDALDFAPDDSGNRDSVLTFRSLLKMVPQAVISACEIKTRDKDQGVPRWIAAMAAETFLQEVDGKAVQVGDAQGE